MRSLVGVIGRSFFLSRFLLFLPQRIRVSPIKSCMISIPVGSPWMSSLVEGVTEVIVNYKLIATQASLNEDEVAEAYLNIILAAIQNAPSSIEEICTGYLHKLCNSGSLFVAVRLLQSLQNRNITLGPNAYNLVMEAAGEANKADIVSRVFKDLMMSCKSLPSSSFINLARGFINTNDHVLLMKFVKEVLELAFPRSMVVINRIIFAFAECRQFDKALLIFDQIKDLEYKPDLITYNMVLHILGRAGRVDEMLYEFSSMKEAGIVPDFICYNTLLNQLQKAGRLDLCLVYIREMGESGIEADLLTYTALIQSFGKSGHIEESLRLFDDMKTRQIRPSIYIYRSLINTAKKMGKVELAMTLLEEMNASPPNLAGPNDFKRKRR
ncbi:pentatricopeptide repeat-containing protein At1g11900 [Ricinus communis]|uniref:pentatricopeptide repeat-containing protein At1g11900 n=1 Tax=Ricinus communis TaxID=3988 RepID=UPI0007723ACE|nr:pentatricopeptide repeat-containing protein At1g11900 [Ricinus communis]|eukprot:XP_015583335.1 pentatricopeptide repeat-containing protein At1g11900 isoform X1 [Ricinus communis]